MAECNFVIDTWYVAAEPEELVNGPCSRKILNNQIAIFKTESGKLVAVEDRCPHRYAPLSKGRIEGEVIRCGYHGACFDSQGRTVSIPGQENIPDSNLLRSYPLVEKYGYIWIWMGNPAKADNGETIPEGFYMGDDPSWASRKEKILSLNAYYELINDNLLDITHAEWVHGSTLGGNIMRLWRTRTKGLPNSNFNGAYYQTDNKTIKYGLHANNGSAPPAFSKGLALKYGQTEWPDPIDFHLDVQWWYASSFVFDVKTKPAGSPYTDGVRQVSLNALTPETNTTTHYFYTVLHNYDIDNKDVTDYWTKGVSHAFSEDEVMIGAQQKVIQNYQQAHDLHDLPKISFEGDSLSLYARNIIRKGGE